LLPAMRSEKHILAVNILTPSAYNRAGGVFMCRQNQLWGFMQLAFGVGVLVGLWIDGGFVSHCFGIGMIIFGFCFLRKK